MLQLRTERIVIHVEPHVKAAFDKLVEVNKTKPSKYGRKLVIDALRDSGLLTDEMIAQITV